MSEEKKDEIRADDTVDMNDATSAVSETEAPVEQVKIAETVAETETTLESAQTPEPKPEFQYRWSYGEQRVFEGRTAKQRHKKGILLYAGIMTTAFLLCFAILIGTIVWYGEERGGWYETSLTATEIYDYVAPATVLIQVKTPSKSGEGSGFFVRSDGYIVTNYHVVEDATSIKVRLFSGKAYVASLVGYEKRQDIAVLKIDGSDFPTVVFGDSDQVCVGDAAIVIGNPAGSAAPWSLTFGVVSAVDRQIGVENETTMSSLIQIDAAVNHGNSGGPLCNAWGEVIGVVTLKLADNEGIGYAVPINQVIDTVNSILSR